MESHLISLPTRRIKVTLDSDTVTFLDAIDYDWYYEQFRVFTYLSNNFFDRDNIKEITVDGEPISMPS
jgi:hypothetical protein